MAVRGRQQLKENGHLEACDTASTRTPSPAQEEHHSWDVDTEMTFSQTSTGVHIDDGSSSETQSTSFMAARATIRGLGSSAMEDALGMIAKSPSNSGVHSSATVTIPAALAPKELHRCSTLSAPAALTLTSFAVQSYPSVTAHAHHVCKEGAAPFTETLLAARTHEFHAPNMQRTRIQDNVPVTRPVQNLISEAADSQSQPDVQNHGAFVKSKYRTLGNVADEHDIAVRVLVGEAPIHCARTHDSTPSHAENLDVLQRKCHIPTLKGPRGFCHMVSIHSDEMDVPRYQAKQDVHVLPTKLPRAGFRTHFRKELNDAGELGYF